jgi:hypothetical protein
MRAPSQPARLEHEDARTITDARLEHANTRAIAACPPGTSQYPRHRSLPAWNIPIPAPSQLDRLEHANTRAITN